MSKSPASFIATPCVLPRGRKAAGSIQPASPALRRRVVSTQGKDLPLARRLPAVATRWRGSVQWRLASYPPAVSASDIASTSRRSEEHTSELQSLMRTSYAVFCLKKKQEQ